MFVLEEMLNLELNEGMIQEYMYIMHDWIDELVNKRTDRIKSKRYTNIQKSESNREKTGVNRVA